jgi:hypothetical protein
MLCGCPSYPWKRPIMQTTCLPPTEPNTSLPTWPLTLGMKKWGKSAYESSTGDSNASTSRESPEPQMIATEGAASGNTLRM